MGSWFLIQPLSRRGGTRESLRPLTKVEEFESDGQSSINIELISGRRLLRRIAAVLTVQWAAALANCRGGGGTNAAMA